MPRDIEYAGWKIKTREGFPEAWGVTTGGWKCCSMEGCTGIRVATRWADGKLTWPCTKDLIYLSDNTYQLG